MIPRPRPRRTSPIRFDVRTPWLEIDDVFFEARGTAWALLHFFRAAEFDFAQVLADKNAEASVRQIIRELEASLEPLRSPMVLNGGGYGLTANHSLVMGELPGPRQCCRDQPARAARSGLIVRSNNRVAIDRLDLTHFYPNHRLELIGAQDRLLGRRLGCAACSKAHQGQEERNRYTSLCSWLISVCGLMPPVVPDLHD